MPRTTSSPSASRALFSTTSRSRRSTRAARRCRLLLVPGGEEADRRSSPVRDQLAGPARWHHRPSALVAGRGEGRDAVALLAAEQLVDRHAERLALDVVEGDVDGGDRRLQHAAALEVLAAIHLLPERADLHRVAADEELAIVLDRADHGLLAAGQAALAPAVDALVGLDLDEQLVAGADPDRIGLDRGDLKLRQSSTPTFHTHPPCLSRP